MARITRAVARLAGKKAIENLDELLEPVGMEFISSFMENREYIFCQDYKLLKEILITKGLPNLKIIGGRLSKESKKVCGRDISKEFKRGKANELYETIDFILFLGPFSFTATENAATNDGVTGFGTPVTSRRENVLSRAHWALSATLHAASTSPMNATS